ncbi:MAG: LysM peptidoglycan-binding domain-containing protein [Myxococcota bacterium]
MNEPDSIVAVRRLLGRVPPFDAVRFWTAFLVFLMSAGAAAPVAAQRLTYRVRSGDTLTSIAARYDRSPHALLALNPRLRNPNRLRVGQVIRIAPRPRRSPANAPSRAAATSNPASRDPAPSNPASGNGETRNRETGDGETGCGDRLIYADRTSDAFRTRVREVAAELSINPNYLMAVMHWETGGTFSPSIRNRHTRAIGLIQFMPSTARRMGTTDRALGRMSAVEQLTWVQRYFAPMAGQLETLEDVYMAVFRPANVGQPSHQVLYRRGTRVYYRNRNLDRNQDGRVTKREIGQNVRDRLDEGLAACGEHSSSQR